MGLTPEEEEIMIGLQSKREMPDNPDSAGEIADAMAAVATEVAIVVSDTEQRELNAAQERASSSEARIAELEGLLAEYAAQTVALAETVIVSEALTPEPELDPVIIVEEPSTSITEIEDDTPTVPQETEEEHEAKNRRRLPFGKR